MILFLCFIPATTEEQWVTSSSVQPRAVSTLELAAAVEMMARNITHFIFYFQMDASWLSIWVIIVNIECEWKLLSKAGQFIQNLICVCGIFRCETVKHLLNIELRGEIPFKSFKSYCKYWTFRLYTSNFICLVIQSVMIEVMWCLCLKRNVLSHILLSKTHLSESLYFTAIFFLCTTIIIISTWGQSRRRGH